MSVAEVMEVDVLFVGAGPASLAGALRLAQLFQAHDARVSAGEIQGKKLGATSIAVLEKASAVGGHTLSGCLLDPRGFEELVPDFFDQGFPVHARVEHQSFYVLTAESRVPLPPPPGAPEGALLVSLSEVTRWMAARCEAAGVRIFPGTTARELLLAEGRVAGVATDGAAAPRRIHAKVTVLGEGPRGALTESAILRFGLGARKSPQNHALGVKEIVELPAGRLRPGRVIHTLGYPLSWDTWGRGWLYALSDHLAAVGLTVSLDAPDPTLDPQRDLQRLKMHPWFRDVLAGGRVIEAGAKILPEGGYHAMPRLYGPGVLLVGDAAGFVDGMRHAGVHLAVKSGMLAAETAYAARILEDYGEESLSLMQRLFEESWAHGVLWRLRNYRPRFRHGPWLGVPRAALPAMTGWDPVKRIASYEDHTRRKTLTEYYGHPDVYREPVVPVDGALLLGKADAVRRAGAAHPDQDRFVAIVDPDLCVTRCREEYGNPCTRFCPSGVFAMGGGETERLQVQPQGCVHCRACEVADPYLNIAWTPPAAGGGPAYRRM